MDKVIDLKRIRLLALMFFCIAVIAVCIVPVSAGAKTNVKMIPADFSGLFKNSSPSVVNIQTEKIVGGGKVFRQYSKNRNNNDQMQEFFNRFFGGVPQREHIQKSLGSGFIIDKEGFIVTNNHVVAKADKIKVILNDSSEYEAKVVGRDANTDLALIKIKTKKDLPALELGNSDKLDIGEWVVAIGNPFGLSHTVTSGIVSAKGRVIGSGPYDDFIQTDTSINPGNSGGPLINLEGKVVGINTAIIQGGQGIGFAIPSNLAKGVIKQLREKGNVTRGWLGVSIQDITQEYADYYGLDNKDGVIVMDTFKDDPAAKAGIRSRDIIIEINGSAVKNSRDLTRLIAGSSVGSSIKIKVLRNGKSKTFKVKLAQRDSGAVVNGADDTLGLGLKEITPELAQKYKLKDESGVVIASVENGSVAQMTGLLPGDVIEEINRKSVNSIRDYDKIMSGIDKGEFVRMVIKRRNRGFLIAKMKK